MLNSSPKEKPWKSVPAKKSGKLGGRSRRADAVLKEVKDVKRRLDFNENEELRLEFHSKLMALRNMVSPRTSVQSTSKSSHARPSPCPNNKVICWSSSTGDFNDLRHNDYFSASTDELASRRDTDPRRRERNYCVMNLSEDPSDFCVVRVDDDGFNQQQKQIREHRFVRNGAPEVNPRMSPHGIHDSTYILHSKEHKVAQYEYSHSPTKEYSHSPTKLTKPKLGSTNSKLEEDTDVVIETDVMQVLLQRLQTKTREKRLRDQVEDIKSTLKERVLNDSTVSADSYSSHVSVDRAVQTLEILSEALKKEDCEEMNVGNRNGTNSQKDAKFQASNDLIDSAWLSGGISDKNSNICSACMGRTSHNIMNKKLSNSVSSNSSGKQVQTNVPLFEEVSESDSKKTDSDMNFETSMKKCQHCGDNVDRYPAPHDRYMSHDDSSRYPAPHNRQMSQDDSRHLAEVKKPGHSQPSDSVRIKERKLEAVSAHNGHRRKLSEDRFLKTSQGVDRHAENQNGQYRDSNGHIDDLGRKSSRDCVCESQRNTEDGPRTPGSFRSSRSSQQLKQSRQSERCIHHDLDDLKRSQGKHVQERTEFPAEIRCSQDSDDGPLTLDELDSDVGSDEIRRGQNKRDLIYRDRRSRHEIVQGTGTVNGSFRHSYPSEPHQGYSDYARDSHDQRKSEKQNIKRTSDDRSNEHRYREHRYREHRYREHRYRADSVQRNDSKYGAKLAGYGGSGRNDDMTPTLTLADVQELHKEVDVRLQGGIGELHKEVDVRLHGGIGERDNHDMFSVQSKYRKQNTVYNGKKPSGLSSIKMDKVLTNKPPNTPKRSASPSKQKGVLIPRRGSNSVMSRTDSQERQSSRRPESKDVSSMRTVNPANRHGASSQGSDSIKMSANITIPDLFGMQITKTIQRPDGEGSTGYVNRDMPERRRLNLSFEESVDGEIRNLQCEVQGFHLEETRRDQGQGSPRGDHSKKSKDMKVVNINRNKMADRQNDADVNENGLLSSQNINEQTRPFFAEKDSLKDRFLSSCLEKLEKDSVRHIEDYDEFWKKRDDLGPASVFEPPERDTSTPRKRFEPYHGNPLLSSSQSPFLHQTSNSSSAADTIMAHLHNPDTLRLLKNLYQADDGRRQDLILLMQHFKTWQTSARHQKQHRENHNLFMRSAKNFLVTHLRKRYFYTWYELAHDHRQDRIATRLFRHHMLKKGLDAFRWAISRSLHRQDMMKVRVHSIQMSASFNKWRERAETRRRHRLQNAIQTWRDFTLEAQRARTLRKSLDQKLLQSMLGKWQEMYQLRVKQHKADYYRRHTLLSHMWLSWSDFTALSIQKRSRNQRALAMYREHLQRRILDEMRTVHQKHLRAKKHFRIRTLAQIFRSWRQSTQICKVERQHDMGRSREHWHAVTLQHFFLHWRETLWNRRAKKMAERITSSHTFQLWKKKWRVNTERRQHIEKQIEMNKLRRSVLLWRDNVVQQKRRQAAAIYSLENVLMRQMLGDWRRYTGVKVDMRQRMRGHIQYYNSQKLSEAFRVWRTEFEKRVDEQTARKFWSDRCAKKASNTWRLICRKQRLKKTLEESEPLRKLTLQHVMFMRWLDAKKKIDREKTEATNMRTLLQRCQLQRRFHTWRIATQLSLTIKPLQQRRNHKLVIQCFDGWRQLTVHKRECRQSRNRFLQYCLQKAMDRWRRQYEIHRIERDIQHRRMMGLALVCLDEWHLVIRRKHAAQEFHDSYLLRDMFQSWKVRSCRQIQHKALVRAEKERKENLKSYYFALWWSNVQDQATETEDAILMLQQRQAHNRIRRSFMWWRTHLRHTHSGRAYHKILCQRSMRTVLLEWHLATDNSLSNAVQSFREELGLPVVDDDDERETGLWNLSEGSVASSSGFHSNKELTLWPDFEDNIDRDSCSPRSSTSVGLAFRRMLSGDNYSGQGSDHGEDGQSVSKTSVSHYAASDHRAQKRECIKNLVITAVTRLRLWPVSVVFDQWLEFTSRQRELKFLAEQLRELHRRTQLTVLLHNWQSAQADMSKANSHFNKVLTGKALKSLVEYKQHRAEKKKLSALAGRYNRLIKYKQFFPIWLAKTQDQQHQHHILHLWSTTTPEEQELIPLELKIQHQFSHRTLRLCFAIWSLKFQFASKIKHAYHFGLLKRTLSGWHDWSEVCQERRTKCQEFRHQRVQSLVFKMWQKRLEQKRESHRRYTETWQSYLHLVVVKWQQWAKVNHQRHLAAAEFIRKRDQLVVRQSLVYWRSLTVRTQAVQHTRDTHLIKRVFAGWLDYVLDRKRDQQKVLQFQVHCYTNLVKCLYGRWRHRYMGRLRQKAEHEELVQMSALQMARVWRRKARASRGRRLYLQFQENKVKYYFSKWKNAYQVCLDREEVLERYLVEKSRERLCVSLETWRTRRLADQAGRVYNRKLQMAVIEEWRIWTKGARERRIRGLALQKALQERLLTVYYRFWYELTRVRQMVQNHSHLKLELRVLQAWRTHTKRQQILRQLQAFLTKKVKLRITQSAFVTMRCRFDYCQGLTDMAASLQEDREHRIMRTAIRTWQGRLDGIMAARCYGKLLVVRTVRQWRRYVQQRRDERRVDGEKMELATRHYNKKLCKHAVRCLQNEVQVKHQNMRRKARLATKYGREWKKQVDMAYTAASLERERLFSQMWTRWRVAYSRRKAANHVGAFEKRQLLSQVFAAWRSVTAMKPVISRSSIPIATSSSLHQSTSPNGGMSSSLPVRTSPSQIPSLQARPFYANRK